MNSSIPSISIIIPTRNEAYFINRCLESILKMDAVPGEREILIVDGMSDDGTQAILQEWVDKIPNLRVLENPDRIVPTAMNIGIKAAQGKYIVRLDAHSEYPPNYLRLCLETKERTHADNVGGAFITLSRDNTLQGKLVQALTTHRFGVGNAGFRIGSGERLADTVPYGCYNREVFDRIGHYDERLVRNQDYELNCRLRKAGGRIWFNPQIEIFYYNQSDLKGLFKQALITGEWNPWMWYVAPYSFCWRHAVPLVFVVAVFLAAAVLSISYGWGALLLTAILGSYFCAALYASVEQSKRYGKSLFVYLPVLFWLYHVAYGLGGLRGLFRLCLKKAPVQNSRVPWRSAATFKSAFAEEEKP